MKVLKFEAAWCGPCKMLSKVMEDAGDKIGVPVEVIDIDQNRDLAVKYGIRGVPTLVVVDEAGNEVKRQSGMMMESALLEFLQQ